MTQLSKIDELATLSERKIENKVADMLYGYDHSVRAFVSRVRDCETLTGNLPGGKSWVK